MNRTLGQDEFARAVEEHVDLGRGDWAGLEPTDRDRMIGVWVQSGEGFSPLLCDALTNREEYIAASHLCVADPRQMFDAATLCLGTLIVNQMREVYWKKVRDDFNYMVNEILAERAE